MPNGKKRGSTTKKKKATSKGARTRKKGRLEEYIAVQQRATKRFSKFASEVAQLSAKGDFKPQTWLKKSSDFWADVAADVAQLTRTFLKD